MYAANINTQMTTVRVVICVLMLVAFKNKKNNHVLIKKYIYIYPFIISYYKLLTSQ